MRRTRPSWRLAALALGAAAVVGVALGLIAHSVAGGSDKAGSGVPKIRGAAIWPEGLRKAPEIALTDSAGNRFHLSSLRGHPVVLTFMDSQCHQECPLEGRALAAGFRQIPAAERPVVVAVSVNPWEDTPGSARRAIHRFGLAGFQWRWLLGTRAQLAPVWKRYRIYVHRTSGDIEHTDALYLIDAKGYERAGMVYPFLPSWVSSDLETLASETS